MLPMFLQALLFGKIEQQPTSGVHRLSLSVSMQIHRVIPPSKHFYQYHHLTVNSELLFEYLNFKLIIFHRGMIVDLWINNNSSESDDSSVNQWTVLHNRVMFADYYSVQTFITINT